MAKLGVMKSKGVDTPLKIIRGNKNSSSIYEIATFLQPDITY